MPKVLLALCCAYFLAPLCASELTIYSARHYDSDRVLYDAFTHKTGIEVKTVEGDAGKLLARIQQEGPTCPGDVLITVDAGNLWQATEAGVFQPTQSSALEGALPAELRHPQGLWFAFAQRARLLFYRKGAIDPALISSYEALATPALKGQVLIRSSTNIYNQSLVASLIAAHGEADAETWAKGLVANFARAPEGNDTAQLKAVAAGAGSVAVANSYYYARLLAAAQAGDAEAQQITAAIGVVFPNQDGRGTHVNVSGAGVLRHAPNPEAAKQFLEFLATPEAQSLFAGGNNEYPVLPGVAANPILESLGPFKKDALSAVTLGENNKSAVRLMDRAGWK